jgi:deoxyribose-phosphate aldolase
MYWAEETVGTLIQALKPIVPDPALVQRILSLIDLTNLNVADTVPGMPSFFEKAQTPLGPVAAVCIFPQFVRQAVAQFAGTPVHVATVVNFPEGTATLDSVLSEIGRSLQEGAQEIDLLLPVKQLAVIMWCLRLSSRPGRWLRLLSSQKQAWMY